MASRGGGARALGSDGSDHAFRQTVDERYKAGAQLRRGLRLRAGAQLVVAGVASAWALVGMQLARGPNPTALALLMTTVPAAVSGLVALRATSKPKVSETLRKAVLLNILLVAFHAILAVADLYMDTGNPSTTDVIANRVLRKQLGMPKADARQAARSMHVLMSSALVLIGGSLVGTGFELLEQVGTKKKT